MKISAIAVAFPSEKVTNQHVIAKIAEASTEFDGDLPRTLEFVRHALRVTGSSARYWVNSKKESPLSLTINCCNDAIEQIGGRSKQIDMVICASVFRFVLEPASANVIADALGLYRAECVDLIEACDGFMKAAKIAQALINTGSYERIIIVNPEFSMTPNYAIRPELFNLKSQKQLAHRFPIFTVGDGVAATIVERDDESPWKFTHATRNDLYQLCTVATPWHVPGELSDMVGIDGPGLFTSWASDLSRHGVPEAIALYKKSGIGSNADILFTHASSTKDWSEIAKAVGMESKWYDIHPSCGNLVSASIPAAIALAVREGKLRRGQSVAALCASAGMTWSTAWFRY